MDPRRRSSGPVSGARREEVPVPGPRRGGPVGVGRCRVGRGRVGRGGLASAMVFAVGGLLPSSCGDRESADIAVIPKSTNHEFWKSIHAGARKASQDTGKSVVWQGPDGAGDREAQIKVVENMINAGVEGIVLAPTDDQALVQVCKEAAAEGIAVVIVDSALKWDGFVSFVASDNYRGGQVAADRVGELLGGTGKVVMMRHELGHASTEKREQGFLDRLKEGFPDVEILSDNQRAGADVESAQREGDQLLSKYGEEVDAIFCPNESTVHGMLRALEDAGLAGEVKFVGFDATDKLVEAMREGHIHGLVLQDPFAMGELAVKAIADHLAGEEVDERIDTGVYLATVENMDDELIQRLLKPDLARWLDE